MLLWLVTHTRSHSPGQGLFGDAAFQYALPYAFENDSMCESQGGDGRCPNSHHGHALVDTSLPGLDWLVYFCTKVGKTCSRYQLGEHIIL